MGDGRWPMADGRRQVLHPNDKAVNSQLPKEVLN
jgi:hypothetical protein